MRCMRIYPVVFLLCACSGGGGSPGSPAPGPPAAGTPEAQVSGISPFAPGCGGGGTSYVNAEVEPHLAVDARDANHLVAAWQQDRWSNGSARGLLAAASFDGGVTWTVSALAFSACASGDAGAGTQFLRATDPWVAFGADGTVHAIGLSTRGASFAPGSTSAVLASRSTDGGRTWTAPVALIRETEAFLDDKETITADPLDARFVYAVWDRVDAKSQGPAYFTRSTDGGVTWEPARAIRDPGAGQQTIGNLIRVLPDGTLVDLYTRLAGDENHVTEAALEVVRSTDRGATWSPPIGIAADQPLGARDPRTGQAIRDGSVIAQMAVAPDGSLDVVWQDGRFSGARDAIALARSTDGGLTWSAPLRVNADPATTAFTPQVNVRADGTIGVSYFTLRTGPAPPGTLPTDHRLAQSTDGEHWTETVVAGPFDLATAPVASGGLFLGDYMGLASAGATFLPLYARTTGSLENRTDVFLARVGPQAKRAATYGAAALAAGERGGDFARRVADNLTRTRAYLRGGSGTPSPERSRAP
jgi:hypothetical protein